MAARGEVTDSVVTEDLTGTCWRDDMWLGFYGLHHANALDYFSVRAGGRGGGGDDCGGGAGAGEARWSGEAGGAAGAAGERAPPLHPPLLQRRHPAPACSA